MSESYQPRIGDTIRLAETHHQAAGCEAVVMAEEVWRSPDEAIPWDGIGKRPAYDPGRFPQLTPPAPRYLVYVPPTVRNPNIHMGWWARCNQTPHSFPYLWARDMELRSRPETKQLNDQQELGSWVGWDGYTKVTTISDSEAGVLRNIADMKKSKLQGTAPGKACWIRPHRGGFAEAMAEAVEIRPNREAITAWVNAQRLPEDPAEASWIKVEPYSGIDDRNGWDTHIVLVSRPGESITGGPGAFPEPVGFTNFPLREGPIQFYCQEVMETKVAKELHVGFTYMVGALFGYSEVTVTKIEGDRAEAESGNNLLRLKRKEDGWYDQHTMISKSALAKLDRVQFAPEGEGGDK